MLSFTHSRWLSVEIECYEIPHALFLLHIELQSKVLSESLVLKKRNSRERMKYPYSSCLSLPSLPSCHMSLSCPSKTTTLHESFWSFTAWKGLSMFRQQRHMQRTKGSGSGSSSSSNEQRTRSRRRQLMLNPKMHQSHERNDASCFPTGTPLIHEGWREREKNNIHVKGLTQHTKHFHCSFRQNRTSLSLFLFSSSSSSLLQKSLQGVCNLFGCSISLQYKC